MLAGFVCAVLREFVLVPQLGRGVGDAAEAPFMLVGIVVSAAVTVGWCRVPVALSFRLAMGMLSLGIVLVAELALSPLVRGSVRAWFDSFTPVTLAVALVLWLAHAAMPVLLASGIRTGGSGTR